MKRIESPIEGVVILEGSRSEDDRGASMKCFSRDAFQKIGIETDWDQTLFVSNPSRATLRGMHWQADPYPEVKLVQCLRGRVYDVVVDMRPDSATFGEWFGRELSGEEPTSLLISPGIAHGYLTLAKDSHLLYHIAGEYHPEAQRVLQWDDADVGIEWPVVPGVISERDKNARSFRDMKGK